MTIGIYASNASNEETKEIRNSIMNLIKEYKEIKQLHGFYIDHDLNNVSFINDIKESSYLWKYTYDEVVTWINANNMSMSFERDSSITIKDRIMDAFCRFKK